MKEQLKIFRQCLILILLVLTFISCSKNNYDVSKSDKFYYSYYCYFDTSFSFIISNVDTIVVNQEYHFNKIDFKTVLTKEDKEQINDWLHKIDFNSLDSLYVDRNYDDGWCRSIKIYNNNYSKSIEVCNYDAPKKLKQLFNRMLIFKRELYSRAIKK